MNDQNGFEIAIIGMSGEFPGAKNLKDFWQNLKLGKPAGSYYSRDELIEYGVSEQLLDNPQFVPTDGATLDQKNSFDASFFGYTPSEAQIMEPQIKLFHEHTWKVLEDGGYNPFQYNQPIGLYAGAAPSTYWQQLVIQSGIWDSSQVFAMEHLFNTDYLCSNVSYKLNLRGPSIFLQSACSTSLVAVHLACQGLLAGDCSMAIAGGVFIYQYRKQGYLYTEGMTHSSDGLCRAFDDAADGAIGGEGIGLVLLKRLDEAIEDGDQIHAIVKGSAINNDGNNKVGFTAPSIQGQQSVISNALSVSETAANTIDFIESHGTGTVLGDPIEFEALKSAYPHTEQKSCAISALKPDIGHLGNAAGVASLIKAVLCLKHRIILPIVHFKNPNRRLELQDSPFYFPEHIIEIQPDKIGRCGVSSFGIGGTNVHVVMEEWSLEASNNSSQQNHLVLLSGANEKALKNNIESFKSFLGETDEDFADVAYTSQMARKHFPVRSYFVARRNQGAFTLQGLENGDLSSLKCQTPVFLFPGQGAQFADMWCELYKCELDFRHTFEECASHFSHLGLDIKRILSAQLNLIHQTQYTQPLIFSVSYALAKQMMNWGIVPKVLIGHSIGEFAAACISGVITLEEATYLVKTRGELMQQTEPRGKMLAVPLREDAVSIFLSDQVSIAAINADHQVVLAGTKSEVVSIKIQLEKEGIYSKLLNTSHAFHSPLMKKASAEFYEICSEIEFRDPTIPIVSTLTGDWVLTEEMKDPGYWARQMVEPVRFYEAGQKIDALKNPIGIESGPGDVLSKLLKRTLPKVESVPVLLEESSSPSHSYLSAVGKLWSRGIEIDWGAFTNRKTGRRRKKVSIPTYSFDQLTYPSLADRATDQSFQKANNTVTYTHTWRIKNLPEQVEQAQTLVCFTDDSSRSRYLMLGLKKTNATILKVILGPTFEQLTPHEYQVTSYTEEEMAVLWKTIQQSYAKIDNVVITWNDNQSNELEERAFHLKNILGSIASLTIESLNLFLIISPVFRILGSEHLNPAESTSIGLMRVAPQEFSNIHCCLIDVDQAGLSAVQKSNLISALSQEVLQQQQAATTVAFRQGAIRWIQSYYPLPLSNSPLSSTPFLVQKSTYLITGGFGKIGARLARYLSTKWEANLVLIGRRALPTSNELDDGDETSWPLAMRAFLEKSTGTIIYEQGDVSNFDTMDSILQKVEEKFGRIHGIIHAAGETGTKSSGTPILALTRSDFQTQFTSKVLGTQVIERLLVNRPACQLVLMSSLSTHLGGLGMAAYASSNAFMDAVAQANLLLNTSKWYCINWDGWAFEQEDNQLLSTDEGLKIFEKIVSQDEYFQIVVSKKPLETKRQQWVESLTEKQTQNGQSDITSATRPELSSPFANPRCRLDQKLMNVWQAFFGHPIGIDDNFFELGGDSLKGMLLVNDYQKFLRERVYISVIYEAPTIRQTSDYFEKNYHSAVSAIYPEFTNHDDHTGETYHLDQQKISTIQAMVPALKPLVYEVRKISKPVVFVLSPSRSGTTLLRVLLGGHPELFAPPELDLLQYNQLSEKGTAIDSCIRALMTLEKIDVEEATQLYNRLAKNMSTLDFYAYLLNRLGDKILVDKSPEYVLNPHALDRIPTYFEFPYIIHLTRHPYATIISKETSKLNIIPHYLQNVVTSSREFGELEWLIGHQNTLRFLSKISQDRQIRISFEELVQYPESTVRRLTNWLGISFHHEMLNPYADTWNRMTDSIRDIGLMIGDPKFHEHQTIDAKVADSWRASIQEDFLSDETWRVAMTFGYRPVEEKYFPIRKSEKKTMYPLLSQQERLYFHDQVNPRSTTYNLPQLMPIPELNKSDIIELLRSLIQRHEALRTSFHLTEHGPVQVIHDGPFVFEIGELNLKKEQTIDTSELTKPFHLEQWPLLRACIIKRDEKRWLFVDKPHIINDGTSRVVLENDFARLLQGQSLPELKVSYADFLSWKTFQKQASHYDMQKAFWSKKVSDGFLKTLLPVDSMEKTSSNTSSCCFSIDEDAFQNLKNYAGKGDFTPNAFWLTIYSLFLSYYSKDTIVSFGIITANRNYPGTEHLVGMFVNTLLVSFEVQPHLPFHQLVKATMSAFMKYLDHHDFPLDEIAGLMPGVRDLGSNLLFDTLFIYENLRYGNVAVDQLPQENYRGSAPSEFTITFSCHELKDAFHCELTYQEEIIFSKRAHQYLQYLRSAAEFAIQNPGILVRDLQMKISSTSVQQGLSIPDFDF